MKVLVITGSRRGWPRPIEIFDLVDLADLLLVGCAPGVDELARTRAKYRGMPFDQFNAGWKTQGNGAGPRRNSRMSRVASYYRSMGCDVDCHAFPDAKSTGTIDCITTLQELGFNVEVHRG